MPMPNLIERKFRKMEHRDEQTSDHYEFVLLTLCKETRQRSGQGPMLEAGRQCRILNISQTYRPPRSVTGIALLVLFFFFTFM
jgi:hypothetical protein